MALIIDEAFVPFPRSDLEVPIGTLFERRAARHPGRLAVKGRRHALTYGALDRMANRLAHALLLRRGPGSEPVGLLFPHDAPVLAAVLAVLKAGKIYVSLDPHHAPARLAGILADAGPALLLTDGPNVARAREVAPDGCDVIDADTIDPALPAEAPGVSVSARDPSAIYYSSGSTGHPKGVLWDQRGLTHRAMLHINSARITAADRIGLLQSVSVAAACRRIFGALLGGACVLPFDLREESPEALPSWLLAEEVTMASFAASVFRHMGGTLTGHARFPALRWMSLQSETVLRSDVELLRAQFPAPCAHVTGLSTTESAMMCELVIDPAMPLDGSHVPVGYPVPDKEVLLLDDDGAEVPRGEVGEIAVRSEFLALGYWRRPDLDREAFRPDPTGGAQRTFRTRDLGRMLVDGCLVHLGRKDTRARLRGRFVDTREVEATLLEWPGLTGAVVSIREDRPGDQRLVAHVVSAPRPSVTDLRAFVGARLGDHLAPSAFVFLERLPLTPNGKVDRHALPPPGRQRPTLTVAYEAPRTPVEKEIAGIWADTLGLDVVGIHDDFLDLGGTSLVAGRIASRVCERFQVVVPLRALLDMSRVVDMASVVVTQLLQAVPLDAANRLLSGLENPGTGPRVNSEHG